MHVCHLCDTSVGGSFFKNITAGLTERGVQVTLVQLCPGEPPSWLTDYPGVQYLSLEASDRTQYPRALRRLLRLLKNESVDILQTHLFYSGIIGVFAKRFYRKTTVALMRHHTDVVRMLGSRVHLAADKWMAEKAEHVLTVSKAARNYMLEVDKIKRDEIDVVYLGFDFENLSPDADDRARLRREFGFGPEDIVVGYIASFAPGKGQPQLIEAFTKLSGEIPEARLLLIGAGAPAKLKEDAEKLSPGKIVFAGWRDDVSACFNAMDVFVQPSLSEAFSQVLIEAMGVGLPVIATVVGGAGEVIQDEVNGLLIAPDDPGAIRDAFMRLYNDRGLMTTIAEAGKASVKARFTVAKMAETHLELYRKWLTGAPKDKG